MAKHDIIYVPGIMDDIYHAQGLAVAAWRIYGVRGHIHPMPWAGSEDYDPKFERLLSKIDKYLSSGHKVSLVGASAGASAVLNAYLERSEQISSLVYIAAKINAPETVGKTTYRENPAFKTSMELLQSNLSRLTAEDKEKMLSLYSPGDKYVPHAATIIPGVREQLLPKLKHGYAIFYSLTLGAPLIMAHAKRLARRPL